MIRFIAHREIDKSKWDNAIRNSCHEMPYACAWYLDIVCPGWDALILLDYKAVMPLTHNRKLGIQYLYQPYLSQQLGVFSTTGYSTEMIDAFLAAIPEKFRYIDIRLNEKNHPTYHEYQYTERKNYTLPLSEGYDVIYGGYHRNCKRNIRKAENASLLCRSDIYPDMVIQFLFRHLSNQVKGIGTNFYKLMNAVIKESLDNGQGEIITVHDSDNNIVAAGWFLKGINRLAFQVCASTIEGKKNQSMYMIVNLMVRKYASSGMIFDFTGSNLPGVAYFNAGFGAQPSAYQAVHNNRLPGPLKFIKK